MCGGLCVCMLCSYVLSYTCIVSRDGSEDSEPEGTVVAVKEVEKETSKVDAAATDLLNKRHLLDMDMDEVIVAQASVPSDWNAIAVDCKSNVDSSRNETVVDVSEVSRFTGICGGFLDHVIGDLHEYVSS
jgi:hypothetical protein